MLPNDQQPCLDTSLSGEGGRKYFSVRGFSDMRSKHNGIMTNGVGGGNNQNGDIPQVANGDISKYYSVDARYNSIKNLPTDLRMKLRQQVQQQPPQQQQQQPQKTQPQQPPPRPPMDQAPIPKQQQQLGNASTNPPPATAAAAAATGLQTRQQHEQSSLEKSKQMSGSVSWLEWTQQLQAYIAWVNSQLRKRPDLKQVQDLRTDLQSGEVLAQLIEIICK